MFSTLICYCREQLQIVPLSSMDLERSLPTPGQSAFALALRNVKMMSGHSFAMSSHSEHSAVPVQLFCVIRDFF